MGGSKVCKKGVKPHPAKTAFAISPFTLHVVYMTQPLALVFYEKLLPGSQLVNRLQDLNYRVQAVNDLPALLGSAQTDGPMLVVMDLESKRDDVCRAIAALKADAATQHIPSLRLPANRRRIAGRRAKAGATLVVGAAAIANYLPQLLNQALQVVGTRRMLL